MWEISLRKYSKTATTIVAWILHIMAIYGIISLRYHSLQLWYWFWGIPSEVQKLPEQDEKGLVVYAATLIIVFVIIPVSILIVKIAKAWNGVREEKAQEAEEEEIQHINSPDTQEYGWVKSPEKYESTLKHSLEKLRSELKSMDDVGLLQEKLQQWKIIEKGARHPKLHGAKMVALSAIKDINNRIGKVKKQPVTDRI